ncbi:MAG: type II toxin-antitoxin system mRNA interferase toxin, RelE/StbE family [Patescibacteria group bacterium]
MEIIYSKYFVKQYKTLQKNIQNKFKERLGMFITDHHNMALNIHSLRGVYAGKYSFNVNADYRVIFAYESDGVAILIDIGTHSKLYK